MQQQMQRPTRRTDAHRTKDDTQEVWPMSAREFMKLPIARLITGRTKVTFTRLSAQPD